MNIDFFQELNEQQKQAVYEEHTRICIIAGPGCGKTRTLVSRFIYLLVKKEIRPENILVLTFAKKAIKEIKKRVFFYTENISPKNLHIYNFHSFCFRVLNKYSYLLGFPESKFLIYNRSEQEAVIRKIIHYSADRKEINTIIAYINSWKNGKSSTSDYLNFDEVTKKRYEIYQKYQQYLKISKSLDFNDLLLYTIDLLNRYPRVKEEYQKQFNHILLDEFQDINSIQWEIIKLISSSKQNIFLVGDPNQAIYGFQGATPELISSFSKDKNWRTIYLNINYRSTNNIIDLTNSFIQKNQPNLIKNLLISLKQKNEDKINWFSRMSVYSIVSQIRWIISCKKIEFSDIIILYRNNYLSNRLEQELTAQKIPYEILGSFKFIEREEIKDLLAFLKTIIYQDNISLLRILNFQEKIGVRTIEKIEQNSEKKGISIYNYLNDSANAAELVKEKLTTEKLEKILLVIFKINEWKKKLTKKDHLSTFLLEVVDDFNYWEHFKTLADATEREKNIQQFINIIQNWENKRRKEYSNLEELLSNFLQWITISFEDKKLVKTRNNLVLSSIHQAKGLEFEVVFFIYLDQGTIPYRDTQDLLEEKRLFYVGITRAKQLLYLISSKETYSPFLDELEHAFLNKI